MKKDNQAIEKYRILTGRLGSNSSYGNNGAFLISLGGRQVYVIASDQKGWEHVSVSMSKRCPTWNEMCMVKDLFWADDEVVIQYHPAKKGYKNDMPFCLHLWKPIGVELPLPPIQFV